MNILFLNSARAWGGTEKWIRLAVTALSRENNVFLAYRHNVVGDRFSVPKIRLPFRHEADIETIVKLITFIQKHNVEILIPSKRKDYVIAGLVGKACKCLNILRLGIVRDLKNSPVQSFIFNRLADGVIVNAEPIKKKLLESGFRKPEKIRVIYNGIDHEEIIELARKQIIKPPFDFTVSAMGELSPRKGFDMLIRSFARFAHNPAVRNTGLVIIGQGTLQEELQKLAGSLDIERHIIFTGFLENPYPYLATSQVFAMTSMNEGISNALLEAAILDNAIITTASGGGITSVLRNGENGFLVNDGDEKQLASVLLSLYTKPDLVKHLAAKISASVKDMFSLEQMTGAIMAFFQDLQKTTSHP